jgi:hypothetical protein
MLVWTYHPSYLGNVKRTVAQASPDIDVRPSLKNN